MRKLLPLILSAVFSLLSDQNKVALLKDLATKHITVK